MVKEPPIQPAVVFSRMPAARFLNSPARVALAGLGLYLTFIFAYLALNQGNPASFLWLGKQFVQEERLQLETHGKLSAMGYDGQFFYRLALNPFTRQAEAFGIRLDSPAYRHQRIGYPLLAWMLSLGNPKAAVFALILINLASICAIVFFTATILQHFKKPPVGALTMALYPGWPVSLARCLSEPLAAACVLASLVLLLNRRQSLASLLLCFAVMTRETTLLIAVAGALVWAGARVSKTSRENPPGIPWHYWLMPAFCYLLWQGILNHLWGVLPVEAGRGNNLAMPLAGMAETVRWALALTTLEHGLYLLQFSWVVGFAGITILCMPDGWKLLSAAWILYGLMGLTMTPAIWSNHPSFYRALAELNTLGILIVMLSWRRYRHRILPVWAFFWLLTAAAEIHIQAKIPG